LVIGIGDSLTAAFGADATNFFNLFTDYRASSFSIGLSSVMTTLPTSFQVYNPNIAGFSVGSGDANSPNARLNVAESGARSADLPPQVTNLITKLQSYDPSLWKHISLFIGGNDLCDSCTDWATYSPARFQANIQAVIDTIRLQIPNVFLSLIGPPDITLLAELTGGWCGILRPFECSCSKDQGTSDLHPQYMTVLHDIEAHYNSLNIENFFVSVQPFFELIEIPRLGDGKPDMTYFAPDCFHFSAKAHSAAALALWNNLMEAPVDKKRTWVIGEPYECPSPNQYLQ
jgi:phospholipase B1